MTTPSIDLSQGACEQRLKNALLEDTNNSDHWDQGVWVVLAGRVSEVMASVERHEWPCGTAACLAGTVVLQAGLVMPGDRDHVLGDYFLIIDEAGQQLLLDFPWCQRNWTDPELDFGGLAALLAGLNITQAARIFDADNSLRTLWDLAAEFTHGRVTLPDELVERVTTIDAQRTAAGG